jgi:hypothetical protein
VSDTGQAVLDAIGDLRTAMDRRLATMDERLASLDARLSSLPVQAQFEGTPPLNRAYAVTRQEIRALRATFNDFTLRAPTAGEIDALHQDVNRVQAENAELARKVATLERLVRELQDLQRVTS